MRLHERFEWDEWKAEENLRKHGVAFEDAAIVLGDEHGGFYHMEEFDHDHSHYEDRWQTTASDPDDRSVVWRIIWTERWQAGDRVTRIISARSVTAAEMRAYENEIRQR